MISQKKCREYRVELEEVLREIAAVSEQPKFESLQDYLGTGIPVLGLRSAQINDCFRTGFPWDELPMDDQWAVWQHIWFESQVFEAMSLALIFVRKRARKIGQERLYSDLPAWVDRVDNWAHSDELSHAYAVLLEQEQKRIFSMLKKWNRDSDPWKRRQSLVVLIRRRNKHTLAFEEMIPLIERLVSDDDYFVQKAVGWALRDIALVFPELTETWVEAHVAELSSPAFATASERTHPTLKEAWKEVRRMERKRRK